jgi:16S rRNA U516 pseudouridylate synthase RsuA-like enzyme
MLETDEDGLIRLQKLLAQSGVASRRACEELMLAGRVEVDGDVVTRLGTKVDPRSAVVRVDGHPAWPTRLVTAPSGCSMSGASIPTPRA